MAQVALFSVIKWTCFQLTKTTESFVQHSEKQMHLERG
jgi:hypothetical protein